MSSGRVDHFAIGVSDWERSNGFWCDVLGAEIVSLPRGLYAYRVGEQLITVHGPGAAPQPPGKVAPGTSHVALEWQGSLDKAAAHLAKHGVAVEHGPQGVVGARGGASSIYFRDPDGSLIEFISYDEANPP
jgi:catechol 2,3-dioxygenase-like lactoylglutathione lyase family enzyme